MPSSDDTIVASPSTYKKSKDVDDEDEEGDITLNAFDDYEEDATAGAPSKPIRRDTSESFGVDTQDLLRDGEYTSSEEKAVLKKLDRRVVLFVALLYMLSFLDRRYLISLYLTNLVFKKVN